MIYADYLFGILSGRTGTIFGIVLAVGVTCLTIIIFRATRMSQHGWLAGIIMGGFLLSAVLAVPYVVAQSRGKRVLGTFKVQRTLVILPPTGSDSFPAPILMEIWFPTPDASGRIETVESCLQLQLLPLAHARNSRRVVLYMPHFGGLRNDNSARLSYLASYGYFVVAFDDIAQDAVPPDATPEEEEVRLRTWHVLTQQDFDRTVWLDDIRVKRQAEKALDGLDRLAACADAHRGSLSDNAVDYDHVGFLGYSFGGSTAAEAAVMDRRIVAVVNLDGHLFGQALAGRLTAPYLYVMSDRPVVARRSMASQNTGKQFDWEMDARDLREQVRLAARNGSAGIVVKDSIHASFSDAVLEPHASRLWLFDHPIASFNAVNLYTREFFDTYLKGEKIGWVQHPHESIPLVETFQQIGFRADSELVLAPTQAAHAATMH